MSGTSEQAATTTTDIAEEDVREFLKANSDFLQRNPDMLDYLHISHASGSAISLVEKQASVLRERNVDMRRKLNTLTANARDNDALYERTRALVLDLLDANDLAGLFQAFTRSMRDDFQVEHASMVLFGDPASAPANCRVEDAEQAKQEIGGLLRGRKAICGVLRAEELGYLFPDAKDIGSAAVMPLYKDGELGFLAVGSSDATRYDSEMGTLFLGHIADIIIRLLPRLAQDAG